MGDDSKQGAKGAAPRKRKWYSPFDLADRANDGFLAVARSTGVAARYLEKGFLAPAALLRKEGAEGTPQPTSAPQVAPPKERPQPIATPAKEPGVAPKGVRVPVVKVEKPRQGAPAGTPSQGPVAVAASPVVPQPAAPTPVVVVEQAYVAVKPAVSAVDRAPAVEALREAAAAPVTEAVREPVPAPTETCLPFAVVVVPVHEPVAEALPTPQPVAEPVVAVALVPEPVAEPVVAVAPVPQPVAEPVVAVAPISQPVAGPVVAVASVPEPAPAVVAAEAPVVTLAAVPPVGALVEEPPVETQEEAVVERVDEETASSAPEPAAEPASEAEAPGEVPETAGSPSSFDWEALLARHPVADRVQRAVLRTELDNLRHGSAEARDRAVKALADTGSVCEPFVVAALEGAGAAVSEAVLEVLLRIRAPGLAGELARLLEAPRPEVRVAALRTAQRLPERDARPLLHAGLRDPDPGVRQKALSYVAWQGSLWALPDLVRLCDDPNGSVKWAAFEALGILFPARLSERLSPLLPFLTEVERRRAMSLLLSAKTASARR